MSKSILDSQLCQSDSEEMCNHNIDDSNDECSKTQWARNMRAEDGEETDSSTKRKSKIRRPELASGRRIIFPNHFSYYPGKIK